MLDDFFLRALVSGVGVAMIAGPFGCFIIWRRLSYFGDTLSHAALLGVAISVLLELDLTLAVFAVAGLISIILLSLQRRTSLPSDALLGLLAHSILAVGLVALAFMTWVRIDLMGLLFGDILAVSPADIGMIWLGGGFVLACLVGIWRPLFAGTVSADLAQAEGMRPRRAELIFTLLIALVIAIAMKIVGVLLITGLLILPAAAARNLAGGPVQMAFISVGTGLCAVISGLFGSLEWNTPSGPSIIVASLIIFVISLAPWRKLIFLKSSPPAAPLRSGKSGLE
jgi:zinc transport system permease protein